jgi:hypothetical protein
MGREAEATVQWRGQTGLSKVMLESTEIILRGGIRGRIARADLTGFTVDIDDLRIATSDGPLILRLGAKLAESWAAALAKSPPSLAQKLGVGPDAPVFVTGSPDKNLAAALVGATTDSPHDAALLMAVLSIAADLATALRMAQTHPALQIWCVYHKGPSAAVGDAQVRAAFRAAGLIDTKSCAVSDSLTATRYGLPKSERAR